MDFENNDRHSDILLDVAVEEIIQGHQKGYALAEDRLGVCNAAAKEAYFYYIIQVRVRGCLIVLAHAEEQCTTPPPPPPPHTHTHTHPQGLGTPLIQVL